MSWTKLRVNPLALLLVFVPASMILHAIHAPAPWVFGVSAIAIFPLAAVRGRATEHQTFNRTSAGLGATLLMLSAIRLVVPAVFHWRSISSRKRAPRRWARISCS